MARNSLLCADVPLRNYSLTHSLTGPGAAKSADPIHMLLLFVVANLLVNLHSCYFHCFSVFHCAFCGCPQVLGYPQFCDVPLQLREHNTKLGAP